MILGDGRPESFFPANRTADRDRYQLAVVAIGYYAFRLWGFFAS
jgi:hypothetical protein